MDSITVTRTEDGMILVSVAHAGQDMVIRMSTDDAAIFAVDLMSMCALAKATPKRWSKDAWVELPGLGGFTVTGE